MKNVKITKRRKKKKGTYCIAMSGFVISVSLL